MTAVQHTLPVRVMQESDTNGVLELLTSALGQGPAGERTAPFFAWKHHENPFGRSPGLIAEHDGRIVAVRMFLRWGLELHEEPVKAVRAVDTATDPEFRGRGLFKDLTLDLLARLEAAGEVDLVFNTPNAKSRPGYLKMGWQPVGTLPVRVAPVRPLRFGAQAARVGIARRGAIGPPAARVLLACPFEPAGTFLSRRGPEVESLLAGTAPKSGLHTPLSLDFLDWRYGAAPGLDYRCLHIEGRSGLRGIAFGRPRARGGLVEFTLSDVIVPAGDRPTARALLALARHAGADHVATHATPRSEIAAVAGRAGYVRVPGHGLGLVTNPRRALAVDPCLPGSWDLALGDLEVF